MKIISICSIAIMALFVIASSVSNAEGPDGKKLFTDLKCNMCHSVESQGIEKKGASNSASGEKKGPPDLSTVGTNRTAEWFTKFLKKEVDVDGKKHAKGWTGTDEELKTLTGWLASLKKK